jgi:hypothetical protein
MTTALLSVEILVGVLVGVACVALTGVFIRRRMIAGGRLLTLCGFRRSPDGRWRLGLARFGSTRLEWFTLMGLTVRPRHSWDRVGLDLDAPLKLEGPERIDLLPDAVGVRCYSGGAEFDLAVQPPAYTALRSWLEAAPPGSTANVA